MLYRLKPDKDRTVTSPPEWAGMKLSDHGYLWTFLRMEEDGDDADIDPKYWYGVFQSVATGAVIPSLWLSRFEVLEAQEVGDEQNT